VVIERYGMLSLLGARLRDSIGGGDSLPLGCAPFPFDNTLAHNISERMRQYPDASITYGSFICLLSFEIETGSG
jgi:hypothetical protein